MNSICLVIRENDPAKVEACLRKASGLVGFFEIRLDYLPVQQITAAHLRNWVQLVNVPVIATLRRKANGGEFEGSEEEQVGFLRSLSDSGVAYMDLEIETVENYLGGTLDRVRQGQTRWIISYHNFQETPADLRSIYNRLMACRPDVVKIATKACNFADNFRILDICTEPKTAKTDLILAGMGELGVYSRILGPSRGSLLTYASSEPGLESAPGQPSVKELAELYRINEILPETKIYGVIGYPIGHSLSPAIHNACFQHFKMNACYLPLALPDVNDLVSRVKYFAGLSVTIPHKVAILRLASTRDKTVQMTGAANTLVIREGQIEAHNTDVAGVMRALKGPLSKGIREVTLLGTGGAARSAAVILKQHRCQVRVIARALEKAEAFANEFGFSFDSLAKVSKYEGDLLINATPVGMSPHLEETPVPKEAIRYRYVFDMVYNPLETRLILEARKTATVISGLEMFLGQATRQFELWTGREMPLDMVRGIVLAWLKGNARV